MNSSKSTSTYTTERPLTTMPFHPHCGICFEAYDETSALASMQCGHAYHHNCLVKWFENRPVCPKCNHRESLPFFRRQLIPIYLDGQNEIDEPQYGYGGLRLTEGNDGQSIDWDNIDWHYMLRTYIVPIVAILFALFLFAIFLGGSYAESELKRLATNEKYYVAEIKKLHVQIDQLKAEKQSSVGPLCIFVLIIGIAVGHIFSGAGV